MTVAFNSHGLAPEAVLLALGEIVGSRAFEASERNKRFLRFVVTEALAGRADQIKAYTIATAVFGRDASFDPQADPIIRIEASRLRRALEHYYLTAGRDAAIRIDIPKGSYVPVFVSTDAASAQPDRETRDPDPPEPDADSPPRGFPILSCRASRLAGAPGCWDGHGLWRRLAQPRAPLPRRSSAIFCGARPTTRSSRRPTGRAVPRSSSCRSRTTAASHPMLLLPVVSPARLPSG